MAEVAVLTAVINKSAEIGANLIVETGSRLYRLKENIEWIERKMRHFKSCLVDAESKKDGRKEVGNLINDMRDLALDIEDILHTYIPEIASHNGKGPFQCVKCAACGLCYGATANSFALEIEKIKRRAQEIEDARERCKVNAESERDGDMDVWDQRKKFLDAPESMFVGREDTLLELERKLSSSNSVCKVVCVVGEAGVGKTTVGKKIYREMLNEFTSSAIVYVSNEPRFEELLLDIAKQVGLEEEKIKENLEINLRSLLNEKKCLIFLDDIWSTEVWDKFKRVIPFHSRSRTIITSRYTDVGRYIGGESSLIELKLLDQEKSWELFSKLIRSSSSENTNERFSSIKLEDIARKIVERCGGLPLAIEVAVGMLRQRRRNEYAWNEVLDSLNTSSGNICLKILSLSYKDLSPDLRPFLLYFGLFPEDQEISASELVKVWVAEKLIQVDGIRNPVDIGAAKLEMLSDRNLIQVSKRNWNGRVKSCRIHDLLHVLCIDMAKENNFFSTCRNMHSSSFSTLRRLTIFDNTSQYSFSNSKTPKLRSLLYFNNSGEVWSLIPNEIGNLSNLIYLKLSGKFKRMPSSIRYLKKLETLDIQQAFFYCDLPRTILRMKHLKHLLMLSTTKIANLFVGNKMYLPNIEILVGLNGDVLKASSLQKLSNLRKLRICFVNDQFIDVIFGTTPISKKLQDLQLTSILQPVERLKMSHYDHLAKLLLHFVDSSPVKLDIIEFPPNLINLTLENMVFLEDPMQVLKKLPRLEILRMNNCVYKSVTLDFSGAYSFPKLQVLAIFNDFLTESPEWIVDQAGMPKLYKLVCDVKYLNVPERIRRIMVEPLTQTSIEEE